MIKNVKKSIFNSLSLILFLGFDQLEAGAVPGTLDTSFGGSNTGYVAFNETKKAGYWASVAITPDGKIIVVGEDENGDNIVAQYTAAGVLDTSFGKDNVGYVTLNAIVDRGSWKSVAITKDGKIVVAGADSVSGIVAQYTAAGDLDSDFGGGNGYVTFYKLNYRGSWNSVAITKDGKIVVAGDDKAYGIVAQYTAAGDLDTDSFGSRVGYVTFSKSSHRISWNSVAITPDGKIVVAGRDTSNNDDGIVVQYTAKGVLDTSFGKSNTGYITFGEAKNASFWSSVAITKDGKIVVAGYDNNNGIVAQYTATGALDTTSFGNGDGYVTFNATENYGYWHSVAIKSDGKIVVAGDDNAYGIVAQYTAKGVLDTTSFGNGDGYVTFNAPENYGYWSSVATTPDGKIIVAERDNGYGIVACYFGVYPNTPAGLVAMHAGINLGLLGGISKANA